MTLLSQPWMHCLLYTPKANLHVHRSKHTRTHTIYAGVQCVGSPASLFVYISSSCRSAIIRTCLSDVTWCLHSFCLSPAPLSPVFYITTSAMGILTDTGIIYAYSLHTNLHAEIPKGKMGLSVGLLRMFVGHCSKLLAKVLV